MDWLKWLEENWIWICPVLVVLYSIARSIVAATPTPKDDKALKEVNKIVRILAGIFGLNMKQGRKIPAIIIVAGVTLAPGCAIVEEISKDPAKQYKVAKIAYAESVATLVLLKKTGKLDEDETIAVGRVIKIGRDVLRNWEDALLNGKDYPEGVALIGPVVTQLRDFIKAGESK